MIMVISRIVGGLGNQMFQYAFGRAQSLAHGTEYALDLDDFRDYPLHNGFELSRIFNIEARELSPREMRGVIGWRGIGGIRRMLVRRRYSWLRGAKILVEPHFHFWPPALRAPKDCYVAGYWQSERYFAAYQDVIRENFTYRLPLTSVNEGIRQRICSSEAVSLHVRRGDYVKDEQTSTTHGACTLEYYAKAIDFIAAQCRSPTFFVFSDDVAWVRNLRIEFPHHYVEHNRAGESYNDMRLMSECRHHIIANSSFSWWGAWLNRSAEKIVVAPKRWFATNEISARDLLPAAWIQL